jgi:hypothetical protein
LCDFILIEKSIISEFLAGSEIEKNETKIKKKKALNMGGVLEIT